MDHSKWSEVYDTSSYVTHEEIEGKEYITA